MLLALLGLLARLVLRVLLVGRALLGLRDRLVLPVRLLDEIADKVQVRVPEAP